MFAVVSALLWMQDITEECPWGTYNVRVRRTCLEYHTNLGPSALLTITDGRSPFTTNHKVQIRESSFLLKKADPWFTSDTVPAKVCAEPIFLRELRKNADKQYGNGKRGVWRRSQGKTHFCCAVATIIIAMNCYAECIMGWRLRQTHTYHKSVSKYVSGTRSGAPWRWRPRWDWFWGKSDGGDVMKELAEAEPEIWDDVLEKGGSWHFRTSLSWRHCYSNLQ